MQVKVERIARLEEDGNGNRHTVVDLHSQTPCPMCKSQLFVESKPFPRTPAGMGSGKENGKTRKKRDRRASAERALAQIA